MSARGPYRRHSQQFKMQLCTDIRDGKLGRRKSRRQASDIYDELWLVVLVFPINLG
jgi:transposase